MGKDVRFKTPADARAIGIEAVYQDLAIVEQLSLWRNFFLGKEIVRKVGPLHILVRREMRQQAATAIAGLGLTRVRSAEEPVWTLSGGERQSVAITRAMHFGAKLLLLDEPTAALSVRETRNVLQSIGRARDHGLGVLYIDHNMSHVLPVADRIVLLELGRVVRVIDRGEVTVEELQELVARTHARCAGARLKREEPMTKIGLWLSMPEPLIAEAAAQGETGLGRTRPPARRLGPWHRLSRHPAPRCAWNAGACTRLRAGAGADPAAPRSRRIGRRLAMASSVELVEEAVRRARYQPEGVRSFGGQRYGMRSAPSTTPPRSGRTSIR